jgi:hypothetical protein
MRTLSAFALVLTAGIAPAADYKSCPPMRPLPGPSQTPMDKNSRGLFVDAARGDDTAAGTEAAPWKTLRHAVTQLRPGDTLYLRGSTYYERVVARITGEPNRPITVRSYPGELAVIDGGYREFAEHSETTWEPVPGVPPGEYRSTRTYPELAEDAGVVPEHENNPEHPRLRFGPPAKPDDKLGALRGIHGSGYFSCAVKVLGNFADSMVPLHGYPNRADLPPDDPQVKRRPPEDFGPGVWYDMKSSRVHVRLSHTNYPHLGDKNYRGETDPRKLPLVIGGPRVVVSLEGCMHLRLRDLVIRGTRSRSLNLHGGVNIDIDHCTIYGGAPALQMQAVNGFRLTHSALRGVCAPWSSRTSEKYYGISCYLFIADGAPPQNHEVEIAHCEVTDNHDGLVIGSIDHLRFHHNYFDNFNDDGLYLTIDMPAGRDVQVYQNYLSRCLTTLSHSDSGKDQEGKEAFVYRNVFDLRVGTHSPTGFTPSRLAGDHGSPIWKPMWFYHNTVLPPDGTWRNYYAAGLGSATRGSVRHLLNNAFVFARGTPGFVFDTQGDVLADGNLHWSPDLAGKDAAAFLAGARVPAKKKQPSWFELSKKTYPPGWTAHDVVADPKFARLDADGLDVSLSPGSPAADAGVPVPKEWPDPLRELDKGIPDIGAIPLGVPAWRVGIDGRFTASGMPAKP